MRILILIVAVEAEKPASDQTARRRLRRVLVQQIHACYFKPDTSLASLLRAGARRLASGQASGQWGEYFAGMLLIEVQALIQWAHTDRDSSGQWLDRLNEARTTAVRLG